MLQFFNQSILNASRLSFTPKHLFANGTQGVLGDLSALSTLFQDTSGTTPVTTGGQTVSLVLDNSKNGVGTNGAARYNLLTYTEQFDNWLQYNTSVAANTVAAPNGTLTADVITINNTLCAVYLGAAATGGVRYKASCYFSSAGTNKYPAIVVGNGSNLITAIYDLTTIAVSQTINVSSTIHSTSIAAVGGDWYLCSVEFTLGGVVDHNFKIEAAPNGTGNTVDGNGDITGNVAGRNFPLWGADLRLASQASLTPTYQPITSSWTVSIPGNHDTQTTAANRPTYGVRRNLLGYTEDFSHASWTKVGCTIDANATIAPDGSLTADKIVSATSTTSHHVYQRPSVPNGYKALIHAKAAGKNWIVLGSATLAKFVYVNLSDGSYSIDSGGYTATVTALADGWYKVSVGDFNAGSYPYIILASDSASATSAGGNGVDGIYIWGASLIPASEPNQSYQRVTTGTDYDPGPYPALRHDGTDFLTASLPDLGGGIYSAAGSVYFATPVGMQSLHNQSIGTTYNLPALSTDIYFWIVYPQRLSTSNERQLERYMLAKAGIAEPDYFIQTGYGPEMVTVPFNNGGIHPITTFTAVGTGFFGNDTTGFGTAVLSQSHSLVIDKYYFVTVEVASNTVASVLYYQNQVEGSGFARSTGLDIPIVNTPTTVTGLIQATHTAAAYLAIEWPAWTYPTMNITSVSIKEFIDGMDGYLLMDDDEPLLRD